MHFTISNKEFGAVKLHGVKNYKGEDVPTLGEDLYPFTSSGQVYDLLAIAAGQDGYNEAEEKWNLISRIDDAVDYVIKEYDYETAYIKTLNDAKDDYNTLADLVGLDAGDTEMAACFKEAQNSDLLFGAWYALNRPAGFYEGLRGWTEDVKEKARDYWNAPKDVPKDLATDCQKTADDASDENFKEYLYGTYESRRNDWRGVYEMASLAMFGNDVRDAFSTDDEDRAKNLVRVELTDDEARAFMDETESKRVPGKERVKKYLIGAIVHQAQLRYDAERRASEARRAEREERTKREKEYREKIENARKEKLLAMKK